jgi:hypothetical protein
MKIKEILKICALLDCLLTASSVLQGVCSSLLRQHTLRLEAAAK